MICRRNGRVFRSTDIIKMHEAIISFTLIEGMHHESNNKENKQSKDQMTIHSSKQGKKLRTLHKNCPYLEMDFAYWLSPNLWKAIEGPGDPSLRFITNHL